MIIKLVRHGQSEANIGTLDPHRVGDHTIGLTDLGKEQARQAGKTLEASFLSGALIYCSPFRRARETLAGIREGAAVANVDVKVYEDPRLREVEHGYDDPAVQQELRKLHGWFYYRYAGGESPADCYDRTSSFLESMMRQAVRRDADSALIVTHGLTIRCFVMRFLHLTVEQYETMRNPENCDIITIALKDTLQQTQFENGKWGVMGLRIN